MGFLDVITVIAASSAAGKKVFLPGFIFSLLVNLGLVRLPGEIAFLSSIWAVIILGVLAALEITAEFFPGVGSTMQSVKLFVAPVASALLAYCMLGEADAGLKAAIILISAACGEAVQVASTGVSLASVQYTGGGGDPIVNVEETISSTGMVLLAVFLPILAIVLVVLVVAAGVAGFIIYRRLKRRKAEKRRAYGQSLLEEQKMLREEIYALGNGGQTGLPMQPQEAAARLEDFNRKLEVNRQALFDFEAQSYFPVPDQYRKKGYLYARTKRLQFVVMLLSVIPGLGHIYAGQWQKGLIILGVSVCIDFLLTPFLMVLLHVFFFAAFIVPVMFRLIIYTDLEMIRQKLNGSIPVRPWEFF